MNSVSIHTPEGVEIGEIGMAIVPADEFGRADHSGQIFPGNAKLAVMRGAGRQDHGIVKMEQLIDRDVAADLDVADEFDPAAFGSLVIAFRHLLERLMIRRDPEPDQTVRHRIAVNNVDPRGFPKGPFQRFGGVKARRTRSDDGAVPPDASLVEARA